MSSASSALPPEYIAFGISSTYEMRQPESPFGDYNTSSFTPSNGWGHYAAASHEQTAWNPWNSDGTRSKYVGGGQWNNSYGQDAGVWYDSSTTPYTKYGPANNNFSSGQGGSAAYFSVPVGGDSNNYCFVVTNQFDTAGIYSSNTNAVSGQPSSLNAYVTSGSSGGDYLLVYSQENAKFNTGNGLILYDTSASNGVMSEISAYTLPSNTGGLGRTLFGCDFSPNMDEFAIVYKTTSQSKPHMHIFDNLSDISGGPSHTIPLYISGDPSTAPGYACEFGTVRYSWDGRYVAYGIGETTSGWTFSYQYPPAMVGVIDRNNSNSNTRLTCITSNAGYYIGSLGWNHNARWKGIDWYPDNETLVLAGYSQHHDQIVNWVSDTQIYNFTGTSNDPGSAYGVFVKAQE